MGSREVSVSEIVRRAIRQSYEQLVAREADLRVGGDPESVHQARVATRRLRSDLRTFEQFVDARWANDLRGDLRWLGAELGIVRDLDVQRERLRGHADRLPPTEGEAARRVVRRLDADHAAAKGDLRAMLNEARYEHVRNKLAAAAATPVFTRAARSHASDAAEMLTAVVRERWTKLRRSVRRLSDNPDDESLHAVRIRAKRCRYASDACEPALGKPARRLSRSAASVQDLLGEHHDAVVAIAWLAKTAHECSPGEAYAIGMLAQIERDAAASARAEFPSVWNHVDTKRIRGWL